MATAMLTPQTPAKKLAKKIGLTVPLYLKREDLHPHGSHKGRSIPPMIKKYVQDGWNSFCISSSGNAAISAAVTVNEYNKKNKNKKLKLTIFTGKNINAKKLQVLKKLANKNISLKKSANPKQSAFQMEKNKLAKNLRQSTDDTALIGYADLAKELSKIKKISAILIPASSGTAAQALQEKFKKIGLNPQIHIAQTPQVHPLADAFFDVYTPAKSGRSLAEAIVDKIAHRREKVAAALKDSRGHAWICADEEIKNAIKLAKKMEKISVSPNSALALAGLLRALKSGWKFNGPIVCVFTGR